MSMGPVLLHNMGKPDAAVWQIVNIYEASEPFHQLISNPAILKSMATLTGAKELRIWHDQIQYKPASMGGVNMWHQDAPYWPILRPMTQVTAWVALDDVDEDNGCMSMVQGSNKWGNTIEFLHMIKDYQAMPQGIPGQADRGATMSGEGRRGAFPSRADLARIAREQKRPAPPRDRAALHHRGNPLRGGGNACDEEVRRGERWRGFEGIALPAGLECERGLIHGGGDCWLGIPQR